MDRNITITVQNQPSSNVDIRFYVKTSEFLALKNAMNSLNQPSGIVSINDISIFKNEQLCAASIAVNAARLNPAASVYEYGYVLSASVASFSTFFFAKNAFSVLPLKLTSFNAQKQISSIKLNWQTENEVNLAGFEVERSTNGIDFTKMTSVNAINASAVNNYSTSDNNPLQGLNYYRLKMIDKDGKFSKSYIAIVDFSKKYNISILPNPAHDYILINGTGVFKQIQIIDVTGKVVKQMSKSVNNRYLLAGLSSGVYYLRFTGADETITSKIIIQ